MNPNTSLQCPVDQILINDNKVRIIALSVFVLSTLFLITAYWPIIAYLALDFCLRTFKLGKYSPAGWLAEKLVKLFHIVNKPVDQAPKRFAAGVGLFFTVLIIFAVWFDYTLAIFILSSTLIIFSFLESFIGFCAGCFVYTQLQKIRRLFHKPDRYGKNSTY